MENFISNQSMPILVFIFGLSLFILSKATDILTDHSVALSRDFGISEVVIGATIVSLGTTLPELSSAIAAIIQETTDFALGNALGSLITNTALVLGVGALAGSIPVRRSISKRLLFLVGSLLLLVFGSLQTFGKAIWTTPGNVSPLLGLVFLLLVPAYMLLSFRSMKAKAKAHNEEEEHAPVNRMELLKEGMIIIISGMTVAFSASALVATVVTVASRIGISEAIIAGTVVALGTSLPELSTTYASAKKGAGGLAMGNVLGANILNILLVLGISAAFSPSGLAVSPLFYRLHFPVALVAVGLLCYFVFNTKKHEISKSEGGVLLLIYFIYLLLNIFS